MARSLKPLFRPEVIRDRLRSFTLPDSLQPAIEKLRSFAKLVSSSKGRALGEEKLKPGFLNDIFCELLGYRTPNVAPDAFTFLPEFPMPGGQGFADAVLGYAPGPGGRAIVAVEVKGPTDPLDIPHGGRRLSGVEQGFDYAINLSCDWIIVTSMVETRLYYKGADRLTCERFDIFRLADNDDALRRFVYVLGADRVLPPSGSSHLDRLLEESRIVGENVTREFYHKYSHLRRQMFLVLTSANPTVPPQAILTATQKLLDRVLFCAFAEDRGLLPSDSIRSAYDHVDRYHPKSKWSNFQGLFRSIDEGNTALGVSRYNGGLFARDELVESLTVPDAVCEGFKQIAAYEFRSIDPVAIEEDPIAEGTASIIDVEILGHIFEQSITDLEKFREEIESGVVAPDNGSVRTRRKKEGAFYTPKFITRFIVEKCLKPVLSERFESLLARHQGAAKGAARRALENPGAWDADKLSKAARNALLTFWEEWREELGAIRILDPACGSGAFLIEAFDQLLAAYQDANARLVELQDQPSLFELNREILQRNLYGVDLNHEAVDICRLSLWIKTAESGKVLTDLDHTIRVGNSLVEDPEVHPRAFDWKGAFPEVFEAGGFDVVIGNPPYIRQEWLSPFKPYLEQKYAVYSGTADLYLYFMERGIQLLKVGGRLGFITSGTFARGNFAAPFRQWLPQVARFNALVNFGENQPFEDAEMVYPTISILEKRNPQTPFPTLFLHGDIPPDLGEAIKADALVCNGSLFEESEWRFQPAEISALFRKLMDTGTPLGDYVQGRMFRGILTGLNDAFIIDTATRDRLVAEDPACADIIKPLLKGEDLRPWYQDWEERWLIVLPAGWTAAHCSSGVEAEAWASLEKMHPSIAKHLKDFENAARARSDQGQFWWELRPCDYYKEFDSPKILWPDIQKRPRFSWDDSGFFVNDKGYILPCESPYLMAILQSRLVWFCISQLCVPLRLRGGLWQYQSKLQFIDRLPICPMDSSTVKELSDRSMKVGQLASDRRTLAIKVYHRILTDLGTADKKLNNALMTWWTLDFPTFRTEVEKALGSNIPLRDRGDWEKALGEWKAEHASLTARIVALEEEMNRRVCQLYGLSEEEVHLMEDFQRKSMTFFPFGDM